MGRGHVPTVLKGHVLLTFSTMGSPLRAEDNPPLVLLIQESPRRSRPRGHSRGSGLTMRGWLRDLGENREADSSLVTHQAVPQSGSGLW